MTRSIEFRQISVDLLRPNPWNTNKCAPETELKIRRSLERNGMFKPIIVRQVPGQEGYEILGGQHRWEQAVELGYESVPVADLGVVDEIKAKEIGVIDNARYGVDDTLAFSELLKEIGDVGELQDFLPYGQADLDAIFASSAIALDDLELPENQPTAAEPDSTAAKPVKTHTILRFKLSLQDAERLTALLAATKKAQGYTTADDLTNAGDALVHLLGGALPVAPQEDDESYSLDDLDALEAALQEDRA